MEACELPVLTHMSKLNGNELSDPSSNLPFDFLQDLVVPFAIYNLIGLDVRVCLQVLVVGSFTNYFLQTILDRVLPALIQFRETEKIKPKAAFPRVKISALACSI